MEAAAARPSKGWREDANAVTGESLGRESGALNWDC